MFFSARDAPHPSGVTPYIIYMCWSPTYNSCWALPSCPLRVCGKSTRPAHRRPARDTSPNRHETRGPRRQDDSHHPSPPRLRRCARPRLPYEATSEAAALGRARHARPHERLCHLPFGRACFHGQRSDYKQRPPVPRRLVQLPRLQSRDAADHHHCRRVAGSGVGIRSESSGRLVRLCCSLPYLTSPLPNLI